MNFIENTSPYWAEDVSICLREGENPAEYYGSINPPVIMSSLFTFPSYTDMSTRFHDIKKEYIYSRGRNPTVDFLERKLARLERGEYCKCTSSGMGAITATLYSLLSSGDHVLLVNNIYGPVIQYLEDAKRNNISFSYITDNFDMDFIESQIKPNTKMIYFESPATMTFKELHIKKLCELAKKKGIITVCDNTCTTPLFQKPITFGVDVVLHSLSKYIGGHSDLIGGALITSEAIYEKIYALGYLLQGSVMSAQDAILFIRGLRTLPTRLKQHEINAITVAEYLSAHPKVKKVNHPRCLGTFNQYGENYGTSGLFSFEIDTEDLKLVGKVLDRLKKFYFGVSWGGFESLALSPHFGKFDPVKNNGIPLSIIRLSIGLEDSNSLIEDLEQALSIL